jgi:hypothetical protein
MGPERGVGMAFDTERHTNVKKKAGYRRIHSYYKGVEQFKAEKQRRALATALWKEGCSLGQISGRLGMSVSTVKRDLGKVSRHLKGEQNAAIRDEDDLFRMDFLNWPIQKQCAYFKRTRELDERMLKCHSLTITLDIDAALADRCPVVFKPKLPVMVLDNARITLDLVILGRRQFLGRIYATKLVEGGISLDTNDSMKAFVKHVLGGVRVVDSLDDGVGGDFSI